MSQVYESRLLQSIPRVADIVSFRLERPETYRFQAGQWFVITFPGPDPKEPWEHHFSHSDAPSDPWMEFTTRLRGSDFKNALSGLPTGSPVQIEGPYGAFVMSSDVERAVFLAGGIGITCVRSILRWVAHLRATPGAGGTVAAAGDAPLATAEATSLPAVREIVVFFANRDEDAIPFRAELDELAQSLPGLRVVHVLSRPGESWQGHSGHIDERILAAELNEPFSWSYFVSGPPAFDEAMREMLEAWGVAADRLKLERFEGY
jgi:glycine betaine catabolism B